MSASILPVSNIINITLTGTPQGLNVKNVNNLAIFTNESDNNLDLFRNYTTAAQVGVDYGTNSTTYKMATAIFSQTPNILTGAGNLVIIPLLNSVSATSGNFVSASLTANLANLIGVTAGDIKITIDGVAYNLLALNFAGTVTLADVATVIQNALPNGVVTATTSVLTITSKKVGSTSTVALAAATGGSGTALVGSTYLNAAGGTATAGANSSGETIPAAITRTSGLVSYCGVITNLNLEDTAIATIATGIQAMDNLFFAHFCSTADIAGEITTNATASNSKTRPIIYTPGQAAANLAKSAYAGRGLSTNFTGSNTSQTMNLKSLSTITPDPGINETLYLAANTAGGDIYVSIQGISCVISSSGNQFFDNPYADLALKFALQTAGFNFLRQTNTKIPQTEQGMNGLKNAYAQVLQQFVTNGSIAPGSWQSPDTFGDPATFLQNILTRGYYIYSQPIISQNQTDRQNRIAPLVQIAIKRAGAIQHSDVIVNIND